MQSPNLPKLIAQINASPSFYMRVQPEFQQLSLPPVSLVFRSPGPKRSFPGYDSNNSASFSDANMLGFPLEMSPMRAEILRAKDNRFSASFIAGGYRDSRLGVSEMRKRRVQRLRARQEVINQAQGKVEASIAAIEEERAAKRHFMRQKRLKLWAVTCQVIQRFMRGRLARKRCAQMRLDRLQARRDQVRSNAATAIQRFVLRRLAVFFEQARLLRKGESDNDSEISSDDESSSETSEQEADGDDGSIPLRMKRSGRQSNTYLSHLTQVDTSEDRAWNSAVVLSEAHAGMRHESEDGGGNSGGSGGSGGSSRSGSGSQSAKHSRRGSGSSNSSGGRRSKSTKANFLTGQGRSREERMDAEEQDRQRRQGILAANHYVKGSVNFMQVVASCSLVQMRVRRFLAIRRRIKFQSAIALLRWFFGKFFRTAPLHLQMLARCGKPRLMEVVEGRDVVSFGRASSSNMLRHSSSSSRHYKRAPKTPNAKMKQVLSAFKTHRKLGVGVVLPSLVTKWLDNRKKYTRGNIDSGTSSHFDGDSFDADVDYVTSTSADSGSVASRRSMRRNASTWSAASLGISRGLTQSEKQFVDRDNMSTPQNGGNGENNLGGDFGGNKSRPSSRAAATSRNSKTPPTGGAPSTAATPTIEEKTKKGVKAKPPHKGGDGIAAAEDMFRAKARELILKRPKAAHNAWDITSILLRVKVRHTKAVEEASLEARQSKAVLKLQSRARILMATRRMATLVAAAQERQFRLATRTVQQQLARFPPEAADNTAAPQWLKHVAPPLGGPASGGGLASRQAGARLRSHRGALNLRRTARDTFWLGGGAEVGAVGSDPHASREVALLSPQRRQPPPAVAARVRGVSTNPGLLSSGLEASRFQGNAGIHPPGT